MQDKKAFFFQEMHSFTYTHNTHTYTHTHTYRWLVGGKDAHDGLAQRGERALQQRLQLLDTRSELAVIDDGGAHASDSSKKPVGEREGDRWVESHIHSSF
jgi:hypothetical protein